MEQLLVQLDRLQTVSPGLQTALRQLLRPDAIPRRQWLLQPGQVSDRLYFIEQGVVRGYYLKDGPRGDGPRGDGPRGDGPRGDGREVTSWFMREGDFIISIVSFYTRQPANEYIEALEDCIVWSITFGQLQQLYLDFPEFNVIGRLLTERYYVLSELRTQNLRMQTAPERYTQLLIDFPEIFRRVPLKYIASHLGISPETLSRLRSRKV